MTVLSRAQNEACWYYKTKSNAFGGYLKSRQKTVFFFFVEKIKKNSDWHIISLIKN